MCASRASIHVANKTSFGAAGSSGARPDNGRCKKTEGESWVILSADWDGGFSVAASVTGTLEAILVITADWNDDRQVSTYRTKSYNV